MADPQTQIQSQTQRPASADPAAHDNASPAPPVAPDALGDRPVRLVTFDLYDTLIELRPTRWERLAAACARVGIPADVATLRVADLVAEDYYTEENTIQPIRDRPDREREAFRLAYMERWLAAAGMPHDPTTVADLRRAYLAEFEADPLGGEYRVFTEVMPALGRLRAAGVKRAVISNADADVTALCQRLAFAHEMEAIITSALVGYEKPDARTFRAALDHPAIATAPDDAVHVGDQPRSDGVGALEVGMRAAVIDRYGRQDDAALARIAPGAIRVGSLLALADAVVRHNTARATA